MAGNEKNDGKSPAPRLEERRTGAELPRETPESADEQQKSRRERASDDYSAIYLIEREAILLRRRRCAEREREAAAREGRPTLDCRMPREDYDPRRLERYARPEESADSAQPKGFWKRLRWKLDRFVRE